MLWSHSACVPVLARTLRQHRTPQVALPGHCRVEMHQTPGRNQGQHDQAAASRQTVCLQGNGNMSTGQALAHDAVADDDCQKKRRAYLPCSGRRIMLTSI